MLRFAIKAGLAGTAVYYIKEEGVFNSADEAIKAYGKVETLLSPHVSELKSQLPVEVPELPPRKEMITTAAKYWNSGVTSTFTFLINLPEHSSTWVKDGFESVMSNEEIKKLFSAEEATQSTPVEAAPKK